MTDTFPFWANQGGESWREEGEGDILPSMPLRPFVLLLLLVAAALGTLLGEPYRHTGRSDT